MLENFAVHFSASDKDSLEKALHSFSANENNELKKAQIEKEERKLKFLEEFNDFQFILEQIVNEVNKTIKISNVELVIYPTIEHPITSSQCQE